MEDRHCLRWSVAFAALAAGVGLAYSVFLFGRLHGHPDWWANPTDTTMLTKAGSLLLHGHLRAIYSTDRGLYALPLSFPLTGVVALATGWFHLGSSPHQEWIFAVIPGFCAMGIPCLYQARRLAWDLGLRRHLAWVQLATSVLVFVPLVEWGHPEDVLALAFVIAALRRMMVAQHVTACLYLSIAVSFKQWAVMLIPLAVLHAPGSSRRRCVLAACALPAALAGAFLCVDFHHALRAFLQPTTDVAGAPGHPSLFGTWLGSRSSQVNRTAATLLAAGAAWWGTRATREPTDLVAVAAGVLLIRPLTETVTYSYYWPPALILLGLAMTAGRGRFRVRDWSWLVLALLWTSPRSNELTLLDWWMGEAVILGMVMVTCRRALAHGGGDPLDVDNTTRCPQFAEVAR